MAGALCYIGGMKVRRLTPRQEAFARNRAAGLGLEPATRDAGYTGGRHQGYLLEQQPRVAARIAELQRPGLEKAMITIENLFEKFVEQGFFDPAVFKGVNSLEDLEAKVAEPVRRLLVKGWKWDRQGRFILELVNKDTALDRIARHLSFYNDTLRVGLSDYALQLSKAQEKVGE